MISWKLEICDNDDPEEFTEYNSLLIKTNNDYSDNVSYKIELLENKEVKQSIVLDGVKLFEFLERVMNLVHSDLVDNNEVEVNGEEDDT